MLNKKWFRVIIIIIILICVVSAYFYSQHIVKIQSYNIGKKINLNDNIVILNKLKIENFEKKQNSIENRLVDYEFLYSLPNNLSSFLSNLLYFYSTPYEFKGKQRVLKLDGYLVSDSFKKSQDALDRYHEMVEISIYDKSTGVRLSNAGRSSYGGDSNFIYFEIRDTNINIEDLRNYDLYLKIKDKTTGDEKNIDLNADFKTKKYGYFSKDKYLSNNLPGSMIIDFVKLLREDKINRINKFILTDIDSNEILKSLKDVEYSKFDIWTTDYIVYEGNKDGYNNVFLVCIGFYNKMQKIVAEQKLYIIKQDDSWKIIKVMPIDYK